MTPTKNMRYFITAREEFDGQCVDVGFIYEHEVGKHGETETDIQVFSDSGGYVTTIPKGALLEITKDDYDLLYMFIITGYDNSNAIKQVISCREGDGSNEKPYAVG